MESPGLPVIVAFSNREAVLPLQLQLSEWGHPASLLNGDSWLCCEKMEPKRPLLMFISGDDLAWGNQERVFQKAGPYRSCIVVDERRRPPWIARRCTDLQIHAWPRDGVKILEWLNGLAYGPRCDALASPADSDMDEFADLKLIGQSPGFRCVLKQIKKIARTSAPVLILGETGTGKELAARAIHYLGPRQNYPFIPVNCGAIPEALLESELFGHEKGAFTDAKENRMGLVEQAHLGALFLDEIDSLSSKGQVALLRFLQDQRFQPVGGKKAKQVDVRVIAASNADLWSMACGGSFRQDLLFRLAILSLKLPAMAARAGDIEILAGYFLRQMSLLYDGPEKTLSPATLALMNRYLWPGNVRELENFIHRVYVIEEGEIIDVNTIGENGLLPDTGLSPGAGPNDGGHQSLRQAKAQAMAEFERGFLHHLLEEAGGNVTRAAMLAGTERRAMGKLLKKYGLSR